MSSQTVRIPRRQWLQGAMAALLCLSNVTAFAAPPQTDRTLKVIAPWEVAGLEPSKSGFVFARLQIAETLVEVDDRGQLVGGLARSWAASPDGLEWRFTLRPGARFHDQSPVTPEAVAASLQRALAQPGLLRNAGVRQIQAAADAVVLRLDKPFSTLPAFLSHASTLVLAPAAYAADGTVRQLIGSGPYQVSALRPPQSLQTRRFDGYDGARPAIAAVDYLAVGRAETRGMMASSGQADLVYTHDPVRYASLQQARGLKLHLQPIPRTLYLKVNAGHKLMSDLRVRQAMSLAIDRPAIAQSLLRAPQAAATQLFAPILAEWHVPTLSPLTQDLPRARALLREAGWQPGADGLLRNAQGQPFKVTLRTFSDRPELPPMASAIQAQFKAVGIDLAVSITNSGEIPAGHQDGTLELALLARNHGLVPDPLGSLIQDFGPRGGDWGAMGWHSAQVSQSIDTMSRAVDPRRRSALRGAIATVLQAELPVIPVAWSVHSMTASERLTGVSVDPLERSYRISRMGWAR
ncbi:ABC transporter substrate-binding protein [Pseudaquabacterium rugosum]|uniref:ABC transporter substrate-binding protein n=1 Tax=Pseudaquabacterium rugosum TaxID=2984194 RepID=A0ABU9BGQ4_9BURK